MNYLTFNNGLKMPAFGIGTWRATDSEIKTALDLALEVGYRLIDTSPMYQNEAAIGKVLRKWLDAGKVKREELFITTKLPPTAVNPTMVESSVRKSLAELQLDYVDLYLIHTPFAMQGEIGEYKRDAKGVILLDLSTDHVAVWKAMESLVKKGLAKSIGISNFNIKQIDRVLKSCTIIPANLQIEHHIYLQQPELLQFCRKNGITVTGYATLGSRGIEDMNKMAGIDRQLPNLMNVPLVKEIAERYKKTPAQVLLRFSLDEGLAVIPKSTNSERLRQNLDVFDFSLDEQEIKRLKALDVNVRICDFRFIKGINKHPEFPFTQ